MLYAKCYMLYAICYMLYAICYMLYAICYMLYAICYMLYAICYMLYAIISERFLNDLFGDNHMSSTTDKSIVQFSNIITSVPWID